MFEINIRLEMEEIIQLKLASTSMIKRYIQYGSSTKARVLFDQYIQNNLKGKTVKKKKKKKKR